MSSGSNGFRTCAILMIFVVSAVFAGLLVGCGEDETPATSSASVVTPSETVTSEAVAASSTTTIATTTSAAAGSTSTHVASTTTASSSITTTTIATTTTAKATATTAKPTTTTAEPTTTTAKFPVVLTVSGASGTVELSMADLKAMPATSGYGGWKNQLGNITAPVSWKGVSVTRLMDLVGGGGSIRVVASDGYEQSLSGGVLSGETSMYDPATGEAISGISGSLRAIVAYAKGGSAIGSGEGPLRIAFVSPEKDQVTDSDMWVKSVISIEVR